MTTVPTPNSEATTPTIDPSSLVDSLAPDQRRARACVQCGKAERLVPAGKLGDVDVVECESHKWERKRAAKQQAGPPEWLTGPCPGWCVDTIDHEPSTHPDDRNHTSSLRSVQLRTMEFSNFGSPDKPDYKPRSLMTDLWQHYRESEPRVAMGDDTDEWWIRLSLDEAQQHALNVMEMVTAGRTGRALEEVFSSPGGVAEHTPWCQDHHDETALCRARDTQAGGLRVGLTHHADEGPVVWLDDTHLTADQAEEIAFALLSRARLARQSTN